jgi:hypothetical protein
MATTTLQLGYSGSVHGSLNDRKRKVARTTDELTLIRGSGVVVAPAPKRHTKGHATRVNSHGTRSIGLTDTTCYHADGTVTVIPRRQPRTRKATATIVTLPTVAVRIRRRTLRATISVYIDYADRYGLDAATVASLYRDRASNGYHVEPRITVAEHGAGWATDNR